ncbi:MAG: hemin-degrading factor [Nevskiales bacterium]
MSAGATRLAGSCEDLCSAWKELATESPGMRFREAAAKLGVSEAALVACSCSDKTQRLRSNWGDLLQQMPKLGRVMCLTRNESVVHERYGCFEQVSVNGMMGLVLGPDIDLRLFLGNWHFGFATEQALPSGNRKSLQFFDGSGTAVFKVYAVAETDQAAWNALVETFTDPEPQMPLRIANSPANEAEQSDSAINLAGFRQDWAAMTDTHQFHGLLKRHKLGRQQALRLIGDDYARPLAADCVSRLLEDAAAKHQPIMVFVGNRGCIQIHSGPVSNLKRMGPWFNVLDADFNLHLREDQVDQVWWVRKPTEDGDVNSVEVFDKNGELILQFFGTRKPGIPERDDWRELTHSLLGAAA